MPTEIYLDTARLGRMCRGARLAEQDFGRLVGRLGSSLYLERFLAEGIDSLPHRMRRQFRNLHYWNGVAGLRARLGQFTRQPINCPTYLFGQSNSLIHFAAHQLFTHANRVLVTDLAWPSYRRCLQQVARDLGKSVVVVPLYSDLLRDRRSAVDFTSRIVQRFRVEGCDGIFLSDITHLGIRMPAHQVLASLVPNCSFSVVDGAQALNHRPINLTRLGCDLYLAGTQKWLRSYYPLRIALAGRQRNAESIETTARSHSHLLPFDPLFNFCEAIASKDFGSFGETVNVSALISAAGALEEAMTNSLGIADVWRVVVRNAATLAKWFEGTNWAPITSDDSQSGILLLQHRTPIPGDHAKLRSGMAQIGIVASAFPDGLIRLSMPRFTLSIKNMTLLLKRLSSLVG